MSEKLHLKYSWLRARFEQAPVPSFGNSLAHERSFYVCTSWTFCTHIGQPYHRMGIVRILWAEGVHIFANVKLI